MQGQADYVAHSYNEQAYRLISDALARLITLFILKKKRYRAAASQLSGDRYPLKA